MLQPKIRRRHIPKELIRSFHNEIIQRHHVLKASVSSRSVISTGGAQGRSEEICFSTDTVRTLYIQTSPGNKLLKPILTPLQRPHNPVRIASGQRRLPGVHPLRIKLSKH